MGRRITKIENSNVQGLGVFHANGIVYLLFQSRQDTTKTFRIATSHDGFGFDLLHKNATIAKDKTSDEDISRCYDFEGTLIHDRFHIFYKRSVDPGWITIQAQAKNVKKWTLSSILPWAGVTGTLVPSYLFEDKYVMYVSGKTVQIAFSKDFREWDYSHEPVFEPRRGMFDEGGIEVEHAVSTDRGILLLYHTRKRKLGHITFKVGAVLLDKNNPRNVLWRANEPLWDTEMSWSEKTVEPLGIVLAGHEFISYWNVEGEGIFAVIYSLFGANDGIGTKNVSLKLKKSHTNPIVSPREESRWEAFNTFNPAAFFEDGRVHLLYRAQGFDYVSVLGYATTTDGVSIDYRHHEPVFTPHEPFEVRLKNGKKIVTRYVSGGGWGGCEDPRITKIDDRLYMTYVAFDGYNPPRIALTSISIDDFLAQRWAWERPVLISPPGVVDKNACIFPEKIKGKYVILHRIYPDILIDFVDSLEFDGTEWLKGEYKISPRRDHWDSRKIGAGPPPIKTPEGWLLIYQAVGNQDAGRYKIGAMLLDLNDPTKVLHRSDAPILEPTESYENEGFKSGVVYPCGAAVLDGILHVYYGGADSNVCVATVNLEEFLKELNYSDIAKLDTVVMEKVL